MFTGWNEKLVAALAEPFPPEAVKSKTVQGTTITFVPWHRYVDRLNALVGGGWQTGTPTVQPVGAKVVVALPITILGVTRVSLGDEEEEEYETVVDERTGEEKQKRTMYGTPSLNAYAQAFKRTCALFGLGLYMYDKGGSRPTQQGGEHSAPRPSGSSRTGGTDGGGFSMDATAPGKKANGRTWRQLVEDRDTGRDGGRGFVRWAIQSMERLTDEGRDVLTLELARMEFREAMDEADRAGALALDEANKLAQIDADGDVEQIERNTGALKRRLEKAGAGR